MDLPDGSNLEDATRGRYETVAKPIILYKKAPGEDSTNGLV